MKKNIYTIIPIVLFLSVISCAKNPASNPSPVNTNTGTATPTPVNSGTATFSATRTFLITDTATVTLTITPTSTITCTSTVTLTPNISFDSYIDGNNTVMDYYVLFTVNSSCYEYATVTVNTDTLAYAYASAYIGSGVTTTYTAGVDYTVTIQCEYGIYTTAILGPGGNIDVTGDVVTYDYEGNSDYVVVFDGTGTPTYNSQNYYPDIDTGFTIPGTAYPSLGVYTVDVVMKSDFTSAFTGPITPSFGHIYIYTTKSFTVIKT